MIASANNVTSQTTIDATSKSKLPGINELPLSHEDAEFFQKMEKEPEPEPKRRVVTTGATLTIKGPWLKHEDELLREAVMKSKPVIWDVVAQAVPGRCATQCKERWRYRLDPDVKTTRFEKWEDEIIINERKKLGNRWTLIANKLPGRTPCAVKNRWYSILRNSSDANE